MKRTIFTLVMGLLILSTVCANAQDVIVKKDNSTILSKVTKISSTEIEYKKWSNQDGPTYTINKSDVVSINYQNGEIDKFNEQNEDSDVKARMTRDGKDLVLDDIVLTNEDVERIFGKQNYETYLGAREQMVAGAFFAVVFVGSLFWDVICISNMSTYKDDVTKVNTWTQGLIIGAIVGDVSLPLMCVFSGIGKGRLNWLADEYNKQHQGYSLNLTPSIIRCKTPQSQNHYALGMTLRYSF